MLTDNLSAKELEMIDYYRMAYAPYEEDYTTSPENIRYILREWGREKEALYQLLGNKFFVTKDIEYCKCDDEIKDELYNLVNCDTYGRKNRSGEEFINAYNKFINDNFPYSFSWRDDYDEEKDLQNDGLRYLTGDEALLNNTYNYDPFEIPLKNGKKLKINKGCKVIRILGKIAQEFDIPGFEDFRICHSQILNQKKLKGKLVISIHPLDFMTMSDNNCGWDSCMNWQNGGSYRQGTVEMMNSPTVVVAYLTAADNMNIGNGYEWNSKKWRQLFLVSKNAIIGVKDYPYHNSDLSRIVIDELKHLAETNMHWSYENDCIQYVHEELVDIPNLHRENAENTEVYLDMPTTSMYSDFGCTDFHWLYLSDSITEKDLYNRGRIPYLILKYSGYGECMICGELNPSLDSECSLICSNCSDVRYCDECGDRCEDYYEVDGEVLCASCYENSTFTCDICGDVHLSDNATNVFVIPKLDNEAIRKVKNKYPNNFDVMTSIPVFMSYDENFHICDRYELKQFKKDFLKENGKIYAIGYKKYGTDEYGVGSCNITYYVYFDDLNDDGKRVGNCEDYDSNKEYANDFIGSYFPDFYEKERFMEVDVDNI